MSLLAATGVILGATYMLYLYRRVVYGGLSKDDVKAMLDLSPREIIIFIPLIFIVVWMGVYPLPILDVMNQSVTNLLINYHADVAKNSAGIVPLGSQLFAFLR